METPRDMRSGRLGTLFVVAVPIGHDGDLGARGRKVLESVTCIAAEDTRVTRSLLGRLGIPAPTLVSYHDHNEPQRVPQLRRRLLAGEDVALVSDAGTPLVSDPGYRLVTAAIESGIPVVPVPGPCAAIVALSASGLPPDRFVVIGFLPREPGPRRALLAQYAREPATLVLYAAPHRVLDVLTDLGEVWGAQRRLVIGRSLTKEQEGWLRGPVHAVRARLAEEAQDGGIRGELTLVVEGAQAAPDLDDERVHTLIRAMVAELPVSRVRDIVASVYDLPRRWVYQCALAARRDLESGDDPA